MLYLILIIEHEHQCDDRESPTGTCGQITYSATGIVLDGGDELLHVTAGHRLAGLRIHLAGICIRRIMGEVATDNKKVLIIEPGFQHLRHPLQFGIVVGGDDDRDDGWYFFETSLQERQLYLQTMLAVVRLFEIGEDTVCLYQLTSRLAVNLHLTQWSGILIHLAVY